MKCPSCENTLQSTKVQNVELDVCQQGCGGVWFDNYEFQKFDEAHEPAGEDILSSTAKKQVDVEGKRSCPKCEGITMLKYFHSIKQKVSIDECGQCGGIWLDAGELAMIREMFDTQEAKEEAFKDYFQDVFRSEIDAVRKENDAKLEKSKRFANMFKFICPSYYIKGDQDWGAF